MSTTMTELAERLADLGYSISKRRFTDWVQKGLLPPPRRHGLGKGKGVVFQWKEPGILSQAVAIYELLEEYTRVNKVFIPLWLMGYEVPIEIVRALFLEQLDNFQEE